MRTCKDFEYAGVGCCDGCHSEADCPECGYPGLITIKINGEEAYVCCTLARFFYPDGSWMYKSKTGQWSK